MKTIWISVLALPLFLACGKPVKQALLAAPTPSPTPTASPTPIVTTSPSPTPSPTPDTSGLKWTNTQITTEVNSCKSNSNTTYTSEQWNTVCSCVYQVVAKTWEYQTYKNNTYYYVQILDENGVIEDCMQKAGML